MQKPSYSTKLHNTTPSPLFLHGDQNNNMLYILCNINATSLMGWTGSWSNGRSSYGVGIGLIQRRMSAPKSSAAQPRDVRSCHHITTTPTTALPLHRPPTGLRYSLHSIKAIIILSIQSVTLNITLIIHTQNNINMYS